MRDRILTLGVSLLLSACSSHQLYVPEFKPTGVAGEPIVVSDLSLGGRKVTSNGHHLEVKKYCGQAELVSVEVRKNALQGLVSSLTLGLVAPAKILFYCGKEPISGQ